MDKRKKLSVVILTYNRKEPLLAQLKSLECQGHLEDYTIWISDNHSNYNVEEWLRSQLPEQFMRIVNVYSWPVNTGHSMNAAYSFSLPETDWMWLLSDDDLTEPNSLETILNDINDIDDEDACWIKYSISGEFTPNKDCTLNTIEEVFNYFATEKTNIGEFIFLCNNVYNLSYLRSYITNVIISSGTAMEPELLPLYAIKNEKRKMILRSACVTNYVGGRISWNPLWAYSKFGNLIYTDLNLNKAEIKAFRSMHFFSNAWFIDLLADIENKGLRHEYFRKMLASYYESCSLRGMICKIYYYALLILGPNTLRKLYNFLRGSL